MIPQDQWQWLGQAGHFVCAADCLFHLHTHVGNFCISTVGEHHPASKRNKEDYGPMQPLSCAADPEPLYYETMVFRILDNGSVLPHELTGHRYKTRDEAQAGHLRYCREWSTVEG